MLGSLDGLQDRITIVSCFTGRSRILNFSKSTERLQGILKKENGDGVFSYPHSRTPTNPESYSNGGEIIAGVFNTYQREGEKIEAAGRTTESARKFRSGSVHAVQHAERRLAIMYAGVIALIA